MTRPNFIPGFSISDGKGFHIRFENGWTASVQFGPGNYGDNYGLEISEEGRREAGRNGSTRAEIAAWDANNNWFEFERGTGDEKYTDTVEGYQPVTKVMAFLNKIAALPDSRVAAEPCAVTGV